MEKENKTVQEKKIQRMVNDLIKMAERRGATYYGSWIEDGRQYVAGNHFCVMFKTNPWNCRKRMVRL